ncbi:unnamed protein product [Caenorhabditis bovis]|uniref:Uncharacterized protein n=1 Tax=Caenorhabditis bovis TaxID=2654633 RepID=A0A8S1EG22_9PELO|nr:unnamed protein product [Caenorhabditis bovis]
MRSAVLSLTIAVIFVAVEYGHTSSPMQYLAMEGDTVEIWLGKFPVYTRQVNAGRQTFRICTAKNKKNKKCGFWLNPKTKKKVKNAAITKMKNGEFLVLKNVTIRDDGVYTSKTAYLQLAVMQKPKPPPIN